MLIRPHQLQHNHPYACLCLRPLISVNGYLYTDLDYLSGHNCIQKHTIPGTLGLSPSINYNLKYSLFGKVVLTVTAPHVNFIYNLCFWRMTIRVTMQINIKIQQWLSKSEKFTLEIFTCEDKKVVLLLQLRSSKSALRSYCKVLELRQTN